MSAKLRAKFSNPPSLSLSINVTNFGNPGTSGGATDKRKTVSPIAERLTALYKFKTVEFCMFSFIFPTCTLADANRYTTHQANNIAKHFVHLLHNVCFRPLSHNILRLQRVVLVPPVLYTCLCTFDIKCKTHLSQNSICCILQLRQCSVWLRAGRSGDRGSITDRGSFFFWPLHPDRLWGPPSLLSNGYQGFFPRG
jgi:hypothetical protein